MKKWLLIASFSLMVSTISLATDKIAIVNTSTLFQKIAQQTGISAKLENEFKSRADELQHEENDLKKKIQRLQHDRSVMKEIERSKLEKDIISQRQTFSRKAQDFEKDRQKRSDEEREKLIIRIQDAVRKVAIEENIDLVIDVTATVFNSINIIDITHNVLNQVK